MTSNIIPYNNGLDLFPPSLDTSKVTGSDMDLSEIASVNIHVAAIHIAFFKLGGMGSVAETSLSLNSMDDSRID